MKAWVNVATGDDHTVRGQIRLRQSMRRWAPDVAEVSWTNRPPPDSPTHQDVPYAFKAHALERAKMLNYKQLLWADASIIAITPLNRIWEHAAEHGVWFSLNGWSNAQWTCDAAYPLMFNIGIGGLTLEEARAINEQIPHIVAGAFAVNLTHPFGIQFLKQYGALARNGAFRGPWKNLNAPQYAGDFQDPRAARCGPPSTLGHRHDQTCASFILGMEKYEPTRPPDLFAYAGGQTEATCLAADGGHVIPV
jgi:hypothetical protein